MLETGLGGRLDSTNVIRKPLACIITALGYDHTDRLGGTMAEIAAEKAGIIKPKRPVFCVIRENSAWLGKKEKAALRVIRLCCEKKHAPLHLIGRNDIEVLGYGRDGRSFGIGVPSKFSRPALGSLSAAKCPFGGQGGNQTIGLADPEAVAAGIAATARWPAEWRFCGSSP